MAATKPGISFRVDDEIVAGTLSRLAANLRDMEPVMRAIEGYLVFSTQRRFERETGPDGKPWKPLRPRTAMRRIGRRRRGYGTILRATGNFYASITGDHGDDFAVVGSNKVQAAIHQLGGEINMPARRQTIHLSTGRGRRRFVRERVKRKESRDVAVKAHTITIPARPYLGLDDADRARIEEISLEHLAREGGIE